MQKNLSPLETRLLSIVRDFLAELGQERAVQAITLQASIDRDLGIDSLGRVELFHRIEKNFVIQLPTSLMGKAETLHDLVNAIANANPPQLKLKNFTPSLKGMTLDLSNSKTLIEVLTRYAQIAPDRPHIYLQNEDGSEHCITYGQLFKSASSLALGLVARGLKPGETVAIMLPTSEAFFYAFFGILLAGGIPVPIYPPFRADKIEEYIKREANILRNAEVRILITFQRVETLGKLLKTFIPSLFSVTTAEELMQPSSSSLPQLSIYQDNPALIQYTSGSTGMPKGVLLSHHNLLSNIRAFGEALGIKPSDVVVSWLPLYHDMGLIGKWLGSLYFGLPLTVLSPLTFLSRPESWLWAIHYHRATLSAAPNFAYELCVRKIDDFNIEGLDLSSWRLAPNGAEPINPKTLERFNRRFRAYKFNPKALIPVYGLAENSVALTFPSLGEKARIDRIEREPFELRQLAIPAKPSDKNVLEFVSCGKPIPHHSIRITNEQNQIVGERKVGELQFTGPSAMCGYYRNAKATQAIFDNGWWATGDLAYQTDDEIFIVGRKKDLIIKAGRNFFPEELEAIVNLVTGVRKGCAVAFGVQDHQRGTEKLIIVTETRGQQAEKHRIIAEITEKIADATGTSPDQIILIPPHTILKTSSGKLRRSATKDAYLQGKLVRLVLPAKLQISKVLLASLGQQFKNGLKNFARILYGSYIVCLLTLTLPPVCLVVLLSPSRWGRRLINYFARIFLVLAGCPLQVEKHGNSSQVPLIYIANHTSYVDILVLAAVLPADVLFIAKQELRHTPILRNLLKKLGYLTVNRIDLSKSLEDAKNITATLQTGKSIIIFPEGTFTYATGLRPFKLGAFRIAVETQVPLCPIAIKGTRSILRSGNLLPRPGAIRVTFCEPVVPISHEWEEVIRLRSVTRTEIAKYCGEYPLDLISAGVHTE